MDRLMHELEEIVLRHDRPFSSIFIGGGNPGCLTYQQLDGMLALAQSHGKSEECTIEMNPETFDTSLFPLFASKKVTRLSMGIQSMDDTLLATLGRNARRKDNLKGISLAREVHALYGTDLSFDLMVCLPGQTLAMAKADIDEIVCLADPSHISLYCLTVEEGTALSDKVSKGLLPVLDEDGQEAFLWGVWDHLKSLGFSHYEVSNFCKGSNYCKHNRTYWNLESYLGLGSSAVSAIRGGQALCHYSQGEDLATYAQGKVFSGYVSEALTEKEHLEEYCMMALRTDVGIDKIVFEKRFSLSFDETFGSVVVSLQGDWYANSPQRFVLTEIGYMVMDEIVLRFALALG